MNWELWQWIVVAVAAVLVGVAKTGIAGLGVLFVAIFTCVLPAKLASGFVLPLLIFGDLVAVWSYRGHAQWRHLWRLFPWTAAGVALGYLAMGRIDDRQAQILVGSIICAMVALHLGRRWQAARRSAGDLDWPGLSQRRREVDGRSRPSLLARDSSRRARHRGLAAQRGGVRTRRPGPR